MLKLIGAVMIMLSGTFLGFSKSTSLRTRKESLEKILYSLRIMENEICYGRDSMDRILKKIEKLSGVVIEKKSFENAGECFLRAFTREELRLEACDIESVSRFSETLGVTDANVQLKNIKNTIKAIEMLRDDAEEKLQKYGKMYRSIGVLVSIFAVIVLM